MVLGAGLAGLSFALEATGLGHEVVVLEKSGEPGGLLKSREVDGYTVDLGGSHILFSKDPEKLDFLLGLVGPENLVKHRRDTRIYYRGMYVKYPFENGVYMLPPEERFEILRGVVEAYVKRRCGEVEPRNFEEWIYAVFGAPIAEKYLVPYNRKLWKRPLSQISLEWVAGRVPMPPIEDVMRSAVGLPTEGYLHQLNFYYPLSGGIESVIRGLLSRLRGRRFRLVTGFDAQAIYRENGETRVSDGRDEYGGDILVSTAPMPDTLRLLDGRERRLASGVFDYNSLSVIAVGGPGEAPPYHWVYFPQEEIPFHRLAILSNYTPRAAPRGHVLLIAESSAPPGSSFPSGLAERVAEWAVDLGFIGGDAEVVAVEEWRYAYIVYRHGYGRLVGEASRVLRENGVLPVGRFGSWRYMNMDETAYRAREAARKVSLGGAADGGRGE